MVALADELDVSVLDSVVHHLYKVAGAALANPVAARGAVGNLGCDGLQDGLHLRPGLRASARHYGRPLEGAFLAAGYARANVQQAFAVYILRATRCVREMGVSTVNYDVSLVKKGDEFFNIVVHGSARLHHQEDFAGAFEGGYQVLQAVGSVDVLAGAPALYEIVHFLYRTVEYAYAETLALHIQDKVFAHYCKAYEADIRFHFHIVIH